MSSTYHSGWIWRKKLFRWTGIEALVPGFSKHEEIRHGMSWIIPLTYRFDSSAACFEAGYLKITSSYIEWYGLMWQFPNVLSLCCHTDQKWAQRCAKHLHQKYTCILHTHLPYNYRFDFLKAIPSRRWSLNINLTETIFSWLREQQPRSWYFMCLHQWVCKSRSH